MNNIIKIRWYHWLLYWLFYKVWTPILAQNPQMVRAIVAWQQQWLNNQATPHLAIDNEDNFKRETRD